MRMSSGPQETEWRSCCMAFVTISPRQEIGVVSIGTDGDDGGWEGSRSGCGRR